MKNPFNFLYYTGLTIFISLSLIVGLFAINLQNILKLIPNKKETATEIVPKTDSYVLENLQPIKQEVPKIEKQETQKQKDNPVNNNKTIAKDDSTQIKVGTNPGEPEKEPDDSNSVKFL